jgi:hypothetical protein
MAITTPALPQKAAATAGGGGFRDGPTRDSRTAKAFQQGGHFVSVPRWRSRGTIFIESCHWDCAEGPLGRIGSVGADGRPEFQKLADIGFVDANGTCVRSRALTFH